MNKTQLSIIVPVFRVEKYLDTCMDSLLNQGLSPQEYEIILVDDGSDDNCPAMCDQYAESHVQVRVIHQQNKGVAAARNTGIRAARGEYIAFVDSDDFLEKNAYSQLLHYLNDKQIDILRFGFILRNVSGLITGIKHPKERRHTLTGEQFLNTQLTDGCFCWTYIFRLSLIRESKTYFNEDLFYEEDTEWLPRIILKANQIYQTDLNVYNYVVRTGSATHPTDVSRWKKMLENNFIVLSNLQTTAQMADNKVWFRSMSSAIITSMLAIIAKHMYSERKLYIARIRSAYPHSLLCKKPFSFKERIKAFVTRISPNLYCFIRHYL